MDPIITYKHFENMYSLIYFKLSYAPECVKAGYTNMSISYTLMGTPDLNYTLYCLVLHEQDISVDRVSGLVYIPQNKIDELVKYKDLLTKKQKEQVKK